mmetsp:Transcript_2367/g.9079  ORF Transcript_2367/g.9079 Transcript_2367/m.9079 type:complete len:347 (+) Transcript_2367:374-1414(+)
MDDTTSGEEDGAGDWLAREAVPDLETKLRDVEHARLTRPARCRARRCSRRVNDGLDAAWRRPVARERHRRAIRPVLDATVPVVAAFPTALWARVLDSARRRHCGPEDADLLDDVIIGLDGRVLHVFNAATGALASARRLSDDHRHPQSGAAGAAAAGTIAPNNANRDVDHLVTSWQISPDGRHLWTQNCEDCDDLRASAHDRGAASPVRRLERGLVVRRWRVARDRRILEWYGQDLRHWDGRAPTQSPRRPAWVLRRVCVVSSSSRRRRFSDDAGRHGGLGTLCQQRSRSGAPTPGFSCGHCRTRTTSRASQSRPTTRVIWRRSAWTSRSLGSSSASTRMCSWYTP